MYRSILCILALSAGCAPEDADGTKDGDGDGESVTTDCDDGNESVGEHATEICGNGVDEDCDGIDPPCGADSDADGYAAYYDCDDTDPAVNPAATEDCATDADDDCDGIRATCLFPDVDYDDEALGALDAYSAHVFADTLFFGTPDLASSDGGVVAFDYEEAESLSVDAGFATNADAVFLSTPPSGSSEMYGIILSVFNDTLCVNSDYWDNGATLEAGRALCYDQADVAAARTSGTLALANANFTVEGSDANGYTSVRAIQDLNGDGNEDLWFGSSSEQYVVYGTGAPFSGTYTPTSANATFTPCASSSNWCAFASASTANVLAVSGDGTTFADYEIHLYALPFTSTSPSPAAIVEVGRDDSDSMAAISSAGVFVIGRSPRAEVSLIDETGTDVGTLSDSDGTSGFGYHVSTYTGLDGNEMLIITAPNMLVNGSRRGGAYVFDVTANGVPDAITDAEFILEASTGYSDCGWRGNGGVIDDVGGQYEVVALSCQGWGGSAYTLDFLASPTPAALPLDIVAEGPPGHFLLRREYVDLVNSRMTWIRGLAQTEAVHLGPEGAIIGWRLHAIFPFARPNRRVHQEAASGWSRCPCRRHPRSYGAKVPLYGEPCPRLGMCRRRCASPDRRRHPRLRRSRALVARRG